MASWLFSPQLRPQTWCSALLSPGGTQGCACQSTWLAHWHQGQSCTAVWICVTCTQCVALGCAQTKVKGHFFFFKLLNLKFSLGVGRRFWKTVFPLTTKIIRNFKLYIYKFHWVYFSFIYISTLLFEFISMSLVLKLKKTFIFSCGSQQHSVYTTSLVMVDFSA